MNLNASITAWEQELTRESGRSAATVQQCVGDTRRFAAWFQFHAPGNTLTDLTPGDVRTYRDTALASGHAPSTIHRVLVSLTLLYDHAGHPGNNPVRQIDPVDAVVQAPHALSRLVWNAVRHAAEQRVRRDHGLALALVCLMRYAGPRVSEVAALQLADVVLLARRGTLIIRRGKGVKHREVPLIAEAREPLQIYLETRQRLASAGRSAGQAHGHPVPAWATWPDGHLFLSQRGPLTDWGIRSLSPNSARPRSSIRPSAPISCGIPLPPPCSTRPPTASITPPATLPAVRALLGHTDIATTASSTRASAADLARMLGEPSESR